MGTKVLMVLAQGGLARDGVIHTLVLKLVPSSPQNK